MKTASKPHALVSTVAGAAIVSAVVALAAAPAFLPAQQAYQPYSYPASPYGAAPQPSSQYNYAQPQYSSQEPYAAPYPDQQLSQPAAPAPALSADQLDQLLAPVALYPDALLAQILAASTYPAQVAVADQWLQQMRAQGYGSPDQIAAGADQQGDWDPSVKALTAFPDVLDLLDHDLEWTTALGDAYYNQPQDVMQTVQVLRDRAQQAGNLETTPQEDVTENQGYIYIAPPDPEIVYVPTYDPWDVYGAPIPPYPGFSCVGALGSFFGGPPIQYGLSFAIGAFDPMPFGMLSWGLDWMGHDVLFHHSGYFTSSASVRDWGLPRGGPRAYNGAYNGWRQNARVPGGFDNRGGYGNRGGFDQRYPTPQNAYQNSNQRGAYGNRGAMQNDPRNQAYSNRGVQQPAYGNARPALPEQNYHRTAPQNYAYRPQNYPNRSQTYANPGYANRAQTYSNPGYSYGYANRPTPQNYAARPGNSYGNGYGNGYSNSYQAYRAPQTNPRAYSGQPYGNSMARNDSGGFRGFSAPRQQNYSAPRFNAPQSYGGGGGGHFSAPQAPSMSHSGGGGGGGRRR